MPLNRNNQLKHAFNTGLWPDSLGHTSVRIITSVRKATKHIGAIATEWIGLDQRLEPTNFESNGADHDLVEPMPRYYVTNNLNRNEEAIVRRLVHRSRVDAIEEQMRGTASRSRELGQFALIGIANTE